MRFTIVGCGALGTILAAHLLEAGHTVNVRVRGRRLEQVREHGLKVRGLASLALGIEKGLTINEPSKDGVLIYAVKTYHMAEALEDCSESQADVVFSLANGVEKTRLLESRYDEVLGCMANFSGELDADGTAVFTRNVALHLGGGWPEVGSLVSVIDAAGITTKLSDDIYNEEWSKFVGWVALLTVAVISRLDTGDSLSNPFFAKLAAEIMRESGHIAEEIGVVLLDRPPFPVATITKDSLETAISVVMGIGNDFKRQAPGHRISALQDLLAGKQLEVHETLGFLVREAKRLSLDCPTLNMAYNIVSGLSHAQK